MAKRKSIMTNVIQTFEDIDFGKNKVRVSPFPPGMYDAILADTITKYPDPDVPVIEVESFAGTEENPETMENFDDPEYIAAVEKNAKVREEAMAEILLDFILNECSEVLDKKRMEKDIERLKKYISFPEDPVEQQIKYITTYLLKTQADYSKIITTSLKMTVIGDKEVADRLDSFQDQVQRGELVDSGSSSPETEN